MSNEGSGLSHEEETVLTYFSSSTSIQNVLQVSRYDELDTCKIIAQLLEAGVLEVSTEAEERKPSMWVMPPASGKEAAAPQGPSWLFWPAVALFLAVPLTFYVPRARSSINQGLASLERADVQVSTDPGTMSRQIWAFRMASPADGGKALAKSLGCTLDKTEKIPDLSKLPNPLVPTPPDKSVEISPVQ